MTTSNEPRTTSNMAAVVGRDVRLQSGRWEFQETRTIAVPPGLTHEQAVAYCEPFFGDGERINGFNEYR